MSNGTDARAEGEGEAALKPDPFGGKQQGQIRLCRLNPLNFFQIGL
jgi:hypothetical protein